MLFEEARELFLVLHSPGVADFYICRPEAVGGMCAGKEEFFPDDFEVKEFERKE